MKKGWFEKKVKELSSIGGYQKPEFQQDSLKLDSNENFVIPKQFQNDIISNAKKISDVREYPLGGVERLIQAISKYLKIPTTMVGVGNGSDQILDLILSNFASNQTKVLTSNPTFGFFEERCKLYSIPLIALPFDDDMKLDIKIEDIPFGTSIQDVKVPEVLKTKVSTGLTYVDDALDTVLRCNPIRLP